VTSDEERLDLYTQRQKKVVHDKAEELERLLQKRPKPRDSASSRCKKRSRHDKLRLTGNKYS
jgi:CRISPR/Cas system-associated exonuclease Cas4 (RecB family)